MKSKVKTKRAWWAVRPLWPWASHLKPQLQVHHCVTTWLQIGYHSLLGGDSSRKGADLEKQNCFFDVHPAVMGKFFSSFLSSIIISRVHTGGLVEICTNTELRLTEILPEIQLTDRWLSAFKRFHIQTPLFNYLVSCPREHSKYIILFIFWQEYRFRFSISYSSQFNFC